MRMIEAKAASLPRYNGKVCAAHPELNGERYTAGSRCVACQRTAVLECYRKPHVRARIDAYVRSEHGKKLMARSKAKYRSTERGRAAAAAYARSEKARSYRQAPEYKAMRTVYMRSYRKLPEVRAKRALRKRTREQHINRHATPSWADLGAIGAVYEAAKARTAVTGELHVVDHIIPLVNPVVCGLHVQTNLRVVHWRENVLKSNRLVVA